MEDDIMYDPDYPMEKNGPGFYPKFTSKVTMSHT